MVDRRALLHAAAVGRVDDVSDLLQSGVSANSKAHDKTGRTALILASASGHRDVVKLLLESDADVEARDATGHTALNWAALRSRNDVILQLVEHGADIDTRDNGGTTPLHYAVGTGNTELVDMLTARGADLETETKVNKMTPPSWPSNAVT
jgi:ankyrin repeat protein